MYYMFAPGGNSVTVVFRGMPFSVPSDSISYESLVEALVSDDVETVEEVLFAGARLAEALAEFGDVEVHSGHVTYQGEEVHGYLVDQILFAQQNGVDVDPFANFLNNVMQNPNPRARQDLFLWRERSNMPLTSDGCILAWRTVRADYLDHHSATMDNSVGAIVEQDRDLCDSNPDQTCSSGLHFCAQSYLRHYGGAGSRLMVVKINPADVVAFPRDYDMAKGRCCRFEVVEEVPQALLASFFDDAFAGITDRYEVAA